MQDEKRGGPNPSSVTLHPSSSRAARILVVDDDPAVRLSLRLAGQKEGFEMIEAANGPAALADLARQRPDLVLLDLMLPGPSGFDVCRAVHQRDPSLPVIILTARGDEVDKVVGLELGADDYITKPFSPRELIARIRAVLRRSARAAQAGRVLTRDQLVTRVWGYEAEGGTRLLDSHIAHLRAKIEPEPSRPRYIQTVRDVGYRLSP